MRLDVEAITIKRLGRDVLRDVSLQIDAGQCVSIIGPNGAGKSTLMAAMIGLLPTDAGHVQLNNRRLSSYPRKQIARHIAYVPQLHEGYLGFTVRDVIESGRYAYVDPLSPLSSQDQHAVDEAVQLCHVEPLLDRTVDTLSGGERQKVWLTAALAQDTPALFLDEPTSALDPAREAELIRILQTLVRRGKTLVVICHDLNLPLALGGRIIGIRDGQIAFDDTTEAIINEQQLEALFGTPFVLHRNDDGKPCAVRLNISEDQITGDTQ